MEKSVHLNYSEKLRLQAWGHNKLHRALLVMQVTVMLVKMIGKACTSCLWEITIQTFKGKPKEFIPHKEWAIGIYSGKCTDGQAQQL